VASIEDFCTDSEFLSFRLVERALDKIDTNLERLLPAYVAELVRTQRAKPHPGRVRIALASAEGVASLRALLLQMTDEAHELRRLSPNHSVISQDERRGIIRACAQEIFGANRSLG
jgi:hypothetical protein